MSEHVHEIDKDKDYAQSWAPRACRQMIEHQREIEDKLRTEQRWDAFRQEIRRWRQNFLDKSPFAATSTAEALYQICETFDLIALLDQGRPREPARTRRGVPGAAAGAGAEGIEARMRDVAGLFGRA